MKAIASLLIFAGVSLACTSTGTERKGSVPVGVSDTIAARASHDAPKNAPANTAAQERPRQSGTLHLAFVGDIMPGITFPASRLPENDGKTLFRDVKELLSSADVAAGNMEGALADQGETTKKGGKFSYAFRIPTRYGKLLADAGLDFMSMANNHAFDFGLDGVKSTEHTLQSNGIAYAGINGRTESAIVERGGVKYGFCAFGHNSYTLKHADLQGVKRILASLKERADIVIVSFHGGAEGVDHKHLPQGKEMFLGEDRGDLRRFAHFCIDNGADVVYGHGPHVVRAVELYKGHFIAYSLGNFCTPYGVNISGISGYAPVLQLTVNAADGTFRSGRINSFIQQRGRGPRIDSDNRVAKEIRSLTAADVPSSGLEIDDEGLLKAKK